MEKKKKPTLNAELAGNLENRDAVGKRELGRRLFKYAN